jgi:hypothetical protein
LAVSLIGNDAIELAGPTWHTSQAWPFIAMWLLSDPTMGGVMGKLETLA